MAMQHPRVIPMSDHSENISQADITPTVLPDDFITSDLAQGIVNFHVPRYHELPGVELYREQVIAYVEGVFRPLDACAEGPWLTPSMVNNYVKMHLISAPNKKLYGREQIARLIVICIFKQVLSISAVLDLFKIQKMTYITDVAYDYVATELEHALRHLFLSGGSDEDWQDSARRVTRESLLVRSAVLAFAARAHLIGYLAFLGYENGAVRA